MPDIYKFAEQNVDKIIELVELDDYMGLCIECGEEAYGVEPDAEKYDCGSCNNPTVYGAEQLLFYC